MKLNGKVLKGPNIEIVVIPRTDEDIVFKAQSILDFEAFTKLCPIPKPPDIIKRGEGRVSNPEDPHYKSQLEDYNKKRTAWMIIKSLEATENLVWEKVKISDSNTWHLYDQELQDAGFGDYERALILNGVMRANCLDPSKIEEARQRFFRGELRVAEHPISPISEHSNTKSGGPVKGSA